MGAEDVLDEADLNRARSRTSSAGAVRARPPEAQSVGASRHHGNHDQTRCRYIHARAARRQELLLLDPPVGPADMAGL